MSVNVSFPIFNIIMTLRYIHIFSFSRSDLLQIWQPILQEFLTEDAVLIEIRKRAKDIFLFFFFFCRLFLRILIRI